MKVELSLHASNLKNTTSFGTSDPYAVVTHVSTQAGMKPEVIGKTETIANSLSPNWASVFTIDFELGVPLIVAVQVYDQVRKGSNKPMGSATFDIGECLGARGNTKAKKFKNGGTVFLHVAQSQGAGLLRLQMKGIKLTNVEGFMKKSDPFFELSCKRDSAGGLTWDNVFRSKVIHDSLDPNWETAVVPLSSLCQGDLDKPILVTVFDFESSGKHVPMGQFETSVKGLKSAETGGSEDMGKAFVLKQKGKDVGKVIVMKAEVAGVESITTQMAATRITVAPAVVAAPVAFKPGPVPATFKSPSNQPTFIDYVSGGCEFNVSVAIDFTGSNGDPRQPGTLHYLHKDGQLNDYEKAIKAIVTVLAKFDSDQSYPVLGFGAKYGGVVRHCFQCGPTAEVHGIQGIIDAYRQTFKSGLVMSGPTDISQVIQTAAARAKGQQQAARAAGKQAYGILLIVTDGAVSDMQQTANAMNACSDAPLSIVIVGVGNADFSSMRFLDDHSQPPGTPDIAQFVQFNEHCRNSDDLSAATLHEIPTQLVSYFQRNGIQPLPAISREDEDIVVDMEEEDIDLSLDFRDDGDIVVASGGVKVQDTFVSGFGR